MDTLGPQVPLVTTPRALRPLDTQVGALRLRLPEPDRDAAPLFAGFVGADAMWNWMAYGPFPDLGAFSSWMEGTLTSTDPRWFLVEQDGEAVGMAALMNYEPGHRRLELGNIWYIPRAQRSTVNTEVTYLAACEAFEHYRARRFEWKCDSLNVPSRIAALRLGFTFEGIFRNHFIVKGRSRDTAWFSITDTEWPAVRSALQTWLYHTPRDANGRPVSSLAALRGDRP